MTTSVLSLALNPGLDVEALRRCYAQEGRVSIGEVLSNASAQALYEHLAARDDWLQLINAGEKLFELSRSVRRDMPAQKSDALDAAVYAGARAGFQFRYETVRVPDGVAERASSDDPLTDVADFLSQGPARDMLRTITGVEAIDFADAQATAYAPGDFLTAHDDAVAGKKRHAAYVLGLRTRPKIRLSDFSQL
ncbi:proline hydroxylase [Sphingomonas floccifaciens]|uniref:Proline hydroxylase n=1 Tax=Sphingomonas floccifaciens TaxID=1844115 RepID=A0ABW4NH80_9SPHN